MAAELGLPYMFIRGVGGDTSMTLLWRLQVREERGERREERGERGEERSNVRDPSRTPLERREDMKPSVRRCPWRTTATRCTSAPLGELPSAHERNDTLGQVLAGCTGANTRKEKT